MSVPETSYLLDEPFGLLDLDHAFRSRRPDLIDPLGHAPGEVVERLGVNRGFTLQNGGRTLVAGFADLGIELNTAQEVGSKLACGLFSTAAGEDVDLMMAVWADEVAHVFDHACDVDLHLPEHFDGFTGVLERYIGRGGNYDGSRQRNGLDQRQGHVPGSGRKIDNQVIEPPPFHLAQELADDRMQHGPTPDQGLISGVEQADGDNLQTVYIKRCDAVLADDFGLGAGAEHQGDVGTIDVGVEQAHLVAELPQSQSQVHSESGLADAAFA